MSACRVPLHVLREATKRRQANFNVSFLNFIYIYTFYAGLSWNQFHWLTVSGMSLRNGLSSRSLMLMSALDLPFDIEIVPKFSTWSFPKLISVQDFINQWWTNTICSEFAVFKGLFKLDLSLVKTRPYHLILNSLQTFPIESFKHLYPCRILLINSKCIL